MESFASIAASCWQRGPKIALQVGAEAEWRRSLAKLLEGGWKLINTLPDMDVLSSEEMGYNVFASRWQLGPGSSLAIGSASKGWQEVCHSMWRQIALGISGTCMSLAVCQASPQHCVIV